MSELPEKRKRLDAPTEAMEDAMANPLLRRLIQVTSDASTKYRSQLEVEVRLCLHLQAGAGNQRVRLPISTPTIYTGPHRTVSSCKDADAEAVLGFWEKALPSDVSTAKFTDVIGKGDVRKRTLADGTVEVVKKEKVANFDVLCPGCSYDLRFSISAEVAQDDDVTGGTKLEKERRSIALSDGVRLDVTKAKDAADHQVELEMTVPSQPTTVDVAAHVAELLARSFATVELFR